MPHSRRPTAIDVARQRATRPKNIHHRDRLFGDPAARRVDVDNAKGLIVDSTGALELAKVPGPYGRDRRRA
jgi:hypothetical protein